MVGSIRSRFFLCALLTALGSFAIADELDAKVSLSSSARPAKAILEDLGKQTNVNLLTTTATGVEPLILHVKDATLRETMDRIASALGAEWQKEANGYRLIRTAKQVQDQKSAVVIADAVRFRSQLEAIKKQVNEFGDYTAAKSQAEFEREQRNMEQMRQPRGGGGAFRFEQSVSPGLFALRRIVAGFDPNFLAQLPLRSRTVFATTPTAMQRPMPSFANPTLHIYANVHNAYAKHAAAAPKEGSEEQTFIIGNSRTGQAFDAIGEAFLIVNRDSAGSVFFSLAIADTKGAIVGESSLSLSGDSFGGPAPSDPPAVDAGSGVVELSDVAKKHAALLMYTPPASAGDVMMFRGGGGRRTMSAVTVSLSGQPMGAPQPKPTIDAYWKNILLNPDKYDPLSFAASDFLLAAAKATGANLVATLGDAAALGFSRRATSPMKPSDVLAFAKNSLDCNVESSANWLVVHPNLLALERDRRIDRLQMAFLLKSIDKEDRLSLNDMAAFAQKMESPYEDGGYADRYAGLIHSSAKSQFSTGLGGQFAITKLYGSFDPQRRQQLLDGGRLPFSQLNPMQKTLANQIVFHERQGPEVELPPAPGQPQERNRSVMAFGGGASFSFGGEMQSVSEERTEFLSQGLPFDAYITIEMDSERAVYATSPTSDEGRFFSAAEYGMYRSIAGNTDVPELGQMTQYDKFKMGRRVMLDVTLHLSPIASSSRFLRDATVDANVQSVAFEQLPEDFRKEVEASRANLRVGAPPVPPKS